MADDHHGAVGALEPDQSWSHAVVPIGVRVFDREVGRHHLMAALLERRGQAVPARAVVPVAVE